MSSPGGLRVTSADPKQPPARLQRGTRWRVPDGRAVTVTAVTWLTTHPRIIARYVDDAGQRGEIEARYLSPLEVPDVP